MVSIILLPNLPSRENRSCCEDAERLDRSILFANGERESFTSDKKGESEKENALGGD